ncbi:ATP-dependent Clp protease proteolytic subunit [Mycobacterium colombiense]|nr:ATP-dependent Clp protease proteolytic subunit [Mycobacterium colombiense]
MTSPAETAKFEAEAAHLLAQTELRKAETRRKLAEAVAAEYHMETARIARDAAVRQEKIATSANHHHYQFDFLTGVYDEPVTACLAQLAIWHRNEPNCPMTIVMDSPGGSVIDGMHLFDQITAYSTRPWDTSSRPKGTHHTTMIVRGYAASMAGILLQSADHRIVGPESYIMVHEVSSFAQGKIGELKDEIKFLDKMSDRVANIFVTRAQATGRPDAIDLDTFKAKWNRQDWWLDSEEAYRLGIVDEIG